MTTRELYNQGYYRQVVEAVNRESPESDDQFLDLGWAHHQLGEYHQCVAIMQSLSNRYGSDTDIGDSARRGLAAAFHQLGEFEEADQILAMLRFSPGRENTRAVAILQEVRRGAPIPIPEVQQMVQKAMWIVPHTSVSAHIINNLTYAMHEGRSQEAVQPYLSMLPGMIEIAIGIYEEVQVQKNHLAGCFFRAAQIFLERGWIEGANTIVNNSVYLWEELNASEDGERYRNNLEGARDLRRQIEAQLT